MKHDITMLGRNVNMDGDYWGDLESIMASIKAKMEHSAPKTGEYARDFFDLPLELIGAQTAPSFVDRHKKEIHFAKSQLSSTIGPSIGCYGYQANVKPGAFAKPLDELPCNYLLFDFCVDCEVSGFREDELWEEAGGIPECGSDVGGPGSLEPLEWGGFSLNTDCADPDGRRFYLNEQDPWPLPQDACYVQGHVAWSQ